MTGAPLLRVGAYARISRNPDGTSDGSDRQIANLEALADYEGWDLVERYIDDDISASSVRVKVRPAYERMLSDIGAGKLDLVVAERLDRLMRRPAEWERFWDTCKAGGAGVRTRDNVIHTDSPAGEAVIRILLAIAKLESDMISVRLKDKYRHGAAKGNPPPGGVRPFGYEPHYAAIREPEAELIRDAARRILAGQSLRSIEIEWHEQGVVTPTGKPWTNSPMIRMLKAPGLAGHRIHLGSVVARDAWPAILDQETHERLVAALRARGDFMRGKPRLRTFVLSGLVVCAVCERRMVSSRDQRGARRYVCRKPPGCATVSIAAGPVEEFVREAVMKVLASPALQASLEAKREKRVDVDMDAYHADQQKLAELRDMFTDGDLTRAEFISARSRVIGRIEAADARMAEATALSTSDLPGSEAALLAAWEAKDIHWRHSLLKLVLRSVIISRVTRRKDGSFPPRETWPTRVRFDWSA